MLFTSSRAEFNVSSRVAGCKDACLGHAVHDCRVLVVVPPASSALLQGVQYAFQCWMLPFTVHQIANILCANIGTLTLLFLM